MRHSRSMRILGHAVRVALFVLATVAAIRFLLDSVGVRGWDPKAFFALLLVTGALALLWRSALDLRKAVRRRKA